MKISGIYKIQSLIKPERFYIGSAINISQRWITHLSHLKKNKHHSIKFQRHYNKYGRADLAFSILIGCDKGNLLPNEQFFIDVYNPYFNTCKIAGSNYGFKHSEESNQKNSKSNKGREPWNKGKKGVYSEEALIKMAKAKEGGRASVETKKKMSRPCTEEKKQKLRETSKNNKPPDDWSQRCKNVWVKRKLDKICIN